MQRRSIEQALPPDAVSSHSKVTLLIRPTCASYVAGQRVEGVVELSCNSERAWLGKIGMELVGQESECFRTVVTDVGAEIRILSLAARRQRGSSLLLD